MKSILLISVISWVCIMPLIAQDNSWKLYDDSRLAEINITTAPEALDFLYREENQQSDSLHFATVHFKNAFIDETIDSVGFRLRGNTSRAAQKKSFKLDFEYFIDGREFYGVDKLNLNGEHNDPSIIRAKLAWDFFGQIGMKTSRAAHAKIYINGAYYGLYISVEHYDKEFLKKNFVDESGNLWKCLWPADLKYRSDNPDDYKYMQGDRRVYELKRNKTEDDYSRLADLIYTINKTSDGAFANALEKDLDVPALLKYMAMNVLLGSWDDYWSNVNNYYLYHQPDQDRFYLIPYDYDNIMGIDWFNIEWATADIYAWPKIYDDYRPLTERVLANKQFRDLYSHFISFYNKNVYALPLWENHLDSLYNRILDAALADTFRTKDYGFSDDDFRNSYSTNYSYPTFVKTGIREFVNRRNQSVPGQLAYANAAPNIYNVGYYPKRPMAGDSIKISASLFANAGLKKVELQYFLNGQAQVLKSPFVFSPVAGSKRVEDADRWEITLPPLGADGSMEFIIFAEDSAGKPQTYPRLEKIKIAVPGSGKGQIFINEFLAKNNASQADEAGEFDDWLELYNASGEAVDLAGYYLSDKKNNLIKWAFPQDSSLVPANGFLLVWCDDDQAQGALHTNFKLSASGEFLALTAPDGISVIDSLSFGAQSADVSFGRKTDGGESWGFLSPTPGESNTPTALAEWGNLPASFKIITYPNPFNGELTIKYNLPKNLNVTVSIFDVMGRKVWQRRFDRQGAGGHTLKWDSNSTLDKSSSSGLYFVRVKTALGSTGKKVLLIK
jgi:CotH kinase protein/Lamin Tail Domain/Secretion system C-terminal sorting domain